MVKVVGVEPGKDIVVGHGHGSTCRGTRAWPTSLLRNPTTSASTPGTSRWSIRSRCCGRSSSTTTAAPRRLIPQQPRKPVFSSKIRRHARLSHALQDARPPASAEPATSPFPGDETSAETPRMRSELHEVATAGSMTSRRPSLRLPLRATALPTDQLLRYRTGRPITTRRHDHLWHQRPSTALDGRPRCVHPLATPHHPHLGRTPPPRPTLTLATPLLPRQHDHPHSNEHPWS
jgi:hypothetical protein